jgi:hypothetical protein
MESERKYRIIMHGAYIPGAYREDRTAAQALLRQLRWYDTDNPVRTSPYCSSIVTCTPGEPDVIIATYFLFISGRIVRHVEASGRRQTCDWGRE